MLTTIFVSMRASFQPTTLYINTCLHFTTVYNMIYTVEYQPRDVIGGLKDSLPIATVLHKSPICVLWSSLALILHIHVICLLPIPYGDPQHFSCIICFSNNYFFHLCNSFLRSFLII